MKQKRTQVDHIISSYPGRITQSRAAYTQTEYTHAIVATIIEQYHGCGSLPLLILVASSIPPTDFFACVLSNGGHERRDYGQENIFQGHPAALQPEKLCCRLTSRLSLP